MLGPVLFLLYASDLVELVASFGLLAHAYADDLQVYCHMIVGSYRSCCNESVNVPILLVDRCPRIDSSLTHKKRNWFGFTVVVDNLVLLGMTLCFLAIALPQFTLLRYLGVMLDSNMTMSQHVLRVCQNCYSNLGWFVEWGAPCLLNQNFPWYMHWFIVSWITVIVFLCVFF